MAEDAQDPRRSIRPKPGGKPVRRSSSKAGVGAPAKPRRGSAVQTSGKIAAVVAEATEPVAPASELEITPEALAAVAAEAEALAGLEVPGRKTPPQPSKNMSRKELATQYEAYVRSIAGKIRKTLSKDIEFDDLVSYGMLGLFEAADRFDAKYGANFMTFAYYRIRGAIYDGLRGMGWVSRTEYHRFRFESRANAFLTNVHDREMAPVGGEKRGADDEVGELADVVSSLVTIYVTALDAMEGFQIKDDRGPPVDESLELLQNREIVAQAVSKLPEQEKKLLQLYYYEELSLEEVGKHLGLSKSWTSRLHTRAIDKLTRLLKDMVDEHYEYGGRSVRGAIGKGAAQPSGSVTR